MAATTDKAPMTAGDVEQEREALHRLVTEMPSELVPRVRQLVELFTESVLASAGPPSMMDADLSPLAREPRSPEERARLLADLEEAAAEVDAGNFVDHTEVVAQMRAYFAGRVSPELMRELDAL